MTEIDVTPEYSRRFGAWTVATGLVSYAFPNGVGTGTTEAYVSAAFDSPLNPTLVMFYDFEEADGAYLNAAVAHTWQVAESVTVDAGLSLGYADAQQGAFYFGDESAGLADLVAQLGATYAASQHVSLTAALAGSSVLSSKYRDALDAGDLAADNVVALVGVAWSF